MVGWEGVGQQRRSMYGPARARPAVMISIARALGAPASPSCLQVRRPIYSTSVGKWQAYKQGLAPLLVSVRALLHTCACCLLLAFTLGLGTDMVRLLPWRRNGMLRAAVGAAAWPIRLSAPLPVDFIQDRPALSLRSCGTRFSSMRRRQGCPPPGSSSTSWQLSWQGRRRQSLQAPRKGRRGAHKQQLQPTNSRRGSSPPQLQTSLHSRTTQQMGWPRQQARLQGRLSRVPVLQGRAAVALAPAGSTRQRPASSLPAPRCSSCCRAPATLSSAASAAFRL